MFKRGEIYLAQMKQYQGMRPVVILALPGYGNGDFVLVCPIASSANPASSTTVIVDGSIYGLKPTAMIVTDIILVVHKDNMVKKLARLTKNDILKVDKALTLALQLEEPEHNVSYKTMEVYGELILKGDHADLHSFREQLFAKTWGEWQAERPDDFPDFVVLRTPERIEVPAAILYLHVGSANRFRVTNIVPIHNSRLSYTEYNNILSLFLKDVVEPLINKLNLCVFPEVSIAPIVLRDLVTDKVARKLEEFSSTANRNTGHGHRLDRERWLSFVTTSFITSEVLPVDLLTRWLIEVEGWSDEVATELAIDYEYSIDLLTYFARNSDGYSEW